MLFGLDSVIILASIIALPANGIPALCITTVKSTLDETKNRS
jgi:hypothetical protein